MEEMSSDPLLKKSDPICDVVTSQPHRNAARINDVRDEMQRPIMQRPCLVVASIQQQDRMNDHHHYAREKKFRLKDGGAAYFLVKKLNLYERDVSHPNHILV